MEEKDLGAKAIVFSQFVNMLEVCQVITLDTKYTAGCMLQMRVTAGLLL
jgi:hypothetical protein